MTMQQGFGFKLKALRLERRLSQEALATKAGFTREYLARLEAGLHNPPLSTLRKLAKALGVKKADGNIGRSFRVRRSEKAMISNQPKIARAVRLKFDLDQIFPLNDPLSVPLLRLMIATDDARHLQKLMLSDADNIDQDNETEQVILEGERGHLFRLLCGHLFEAGVAFRNLIGNKKCLARLEAAVENNEEAKAALERVRKAYHVDEKKEGFSYRFLHPMRQIGFHYEDEKVRESFAKYKNSEVLQGSLALVDFTGLGRYTVTDSLVKLVIADALGGDIIALLKNYPERMKDAVKLAADLGYVVDHLLVHLFESHPEAILEQHEDVITIPPSIQLAKEQVAKERRA